MRLVPFHWLQQLGSSAPGARPGLPGASSAAPSAITESAESLGLSTPVPAALDPAAILSEARLRLAEPLAILSDIHLPASLQATGRLEELRPLWSEARTVVFNGDTFRIRDAAERERARQVQRRLVDLCARDSVEAVFLAGNADAEISRRRHLLLGGGAVLVMHGDAMVPGVSPWRSSFARRLEQVKLSALERVPAPYRDRIEGQLLAVHQSLVDLQYGTGPKPRRPSTLRRVVSRAPWCLVNPLGVFAVWRVWRDTPLLAGRFAQRYVPEARFVITGHTHHFGVWQMEGRTIINTGSFGRMGRAHVVTIHDGKIAVRRIDRSRGRYSPGTFAAHFQL